RDCKASAKAAIKRFGSLRAVLEAGPVELRKIPGIGPNNIFGLKLIPAVARRYLEERISGSDFIENSQQVIEFLRHSIQERDQEVFMVIYLNGRNQILGTEELFRGTLTASAVYPREVIKKILERKAAAVVLVHNHPSGNRQPSRDDLAITEKLKAAAATIDVAIHDHIIVAGNGYYSLADNGQL
ncbi:MAG: DNA repair protein RadC, partial [Candidatus Neomarinimicrobiota bacterium]